MTLRPPRDEEFDAMLELMNAHQLAAFGDVWVERNAVDVLNPVGIENAVNPRDHLRVFRPPVVKSEDDGSLGKLSTSAAS